MYHLYQSSHHLFAGREVGYDSVAQRSDSAYVCVLFFIHHLGLLAHGDHLVCSPVESHDRRLVNHNLIIRDDDGIGCTEVHCYFLYK